jgi:hypothetical protein
MVNEEGYELEHELDFEDNEIHQLGGAQHTNPRNSASSNTSSGATTRIPTTRLCHGIGVTCGASKTGDAVTGAVTKFGHHTEPHTLTAVSQVQTGISTYSFHPVESNLFTQLYRIIFLQLL